MLKYLISLILLLSIIPISVFSVPCQTIKEIKVSSGPSDLGYFQFGDRVPIRSDLSQNPIKISYGFSGQCDEETNIEAKLFSQANYVQANSNRYDSQRDTTFYDFTFQANLEVQNSFNTYLKINSGPDLQPLLFVLDRNPPEIPTINIFVDNQLKKSPVILKGGENISLEIFYNDAESGVKEIIIGSENIEVNQSPFSSSIGKITKNLEISSSQTIQITAIDRFDKSTTKNIEFILDSNPPSFRVLDYSIIQGGSGLEFSMSLEIQDESFSNFDSSSIRVEPVDENLLSLPREAYCNNYGNSPNIKRCFFNGYKINFRETRDIDFNIFLKDMAGNELNSQFSVNIFIDNFPPQINNFYFENSVGGRNIISGRGNLSGILTLTYDDDSEIINFNEDFDKISEPRPIPEPCQENSICWRLSNENLGVYSEELRENFPFKVRITDEFSNSAESIVNITIDNLPPEVINYSFIEKYQIADSLFQSGELIDFKINFREKNFNLKLITGNFSMVASGENSDELIPSCRLENEEIYSCIFSDIRLLNGYFNRSFTINIIDDAGNKIEFEKFIEVFNISQGEIPSQFRIVDNSGSRASINSLKSIVPVSRHLLAVSNPLVWFKGRIEKIEPNSEFKLVNYELISCNDIKIGVSGFDQNFSDILQVIDESLYPDRVVTIYSSEDNSEVPREFAASFQLSSTSRVLNKESTNCQFSVLFRDEQTIYQPGQLINVSFNMDFYGLVQDRENPENVLLRRYAKDLKEDIDRTKYLGGKFDTIYSIYLPLKTICTSINAVESAFSNAVVITNTASNLLKGIPIAGGFALAIDGATTKSQGALSSLIEGVGYGGFNINTLCSLVSCERGRVFSKYTDGFLEKLNLADNICRTTSKVLGKSGEEDESGEGDDSS